MTDKQKIFIIYKKLAELIEETRREKHISDYLVDVLNEVSNTDEMVGLVNSINGGKPDAFDKIAEVVNESSATLDSLYSFVQLI